MIWEIGLSNLSRTGTLKRSQNCIMFNMTNEIAYVFFSIHKRWFKLNFMVFKVIFFPFIRRLCLGCLKRFVLKSLSISSTLNILWRYWRFITRCTLILLVKGRVSSIKKGLQILLCLQSCIKHDLRTKITINTLLRLYLRYSALDHHFKYKVLVGVRPRDHS